MREGGGEQAVGEHPGVGWSGSGCTWRVEPTGFPDEYVISLLDMMRHPSGYFLGV